VAARSLKHFERGKQAFARGECMNPNALIDWKNGYRAAMREAERGERRKAERKERHKVFERSRRDMLKDAGRAEATRQCVAETLTRTRVSYFDKTEDERRAIDARMSWLWSKDGRT